jgi:hypothetical protein
MGYKVGVICGSKIWNHKNSPALRVTICDQLNKGSLDGVILTPETGGFGLSMVGANNVIFLASMYTEAYEDQVLGKTSSSLYTESILGRISRPGQNLTPRGFVIGNVDFPPDNAAFKIKQLRGEDHKNMTSLLTPQELALYLKARNRTIDEVSDTEADAHREVLDLTSEYDGQKIIDLTGDEGHMMLD